MRLIGCRKPDSTSIGVGLERGAGLERDTEEDVAGPDLERDTEECEAGPGPDLVLLPASLCKGKTITGPTGSTG